MKNCRTTLLWTGLLGVMVASACAVETADTEEQPVKLQQVTLARGAVRLSLPDAWKSRQPASRIVEREFAVPAEEGDKAEGRLTMTRSSGSVKENVGRWIGQFLQPDGKPTVDRAKVREKEINGQEVTLVDISGTYKDQPGGGPFVRRPVVERPGYRMLGGIVQTKGHGQYFFKLYGPEKTILAAEKPFLAMMETVTSN